MHGQCGVDFYRKWSRYIDLYFVFFHTSNMLLMNPMECVGGEGKRKLFSKIESWWDEYEPDVVHFFNLVTFCVFFFS